MTRRKHSPYRAKISRAQELLYGRRKRGSGPEQKIDEPEFNLLTISADELHDLDSAALLDILEKLNQRADPPDQNQTQYDELLAAVEACQDVHDLVEVSNEIVDAIIDMQYAINNNEPPY